MSEPKHPAATLPYASPPASGPGLRRAAWSIGLAVTAWAIICAAVIVEILGSGDSTKMDAVDASAVVVGGVFALSAMAAGIGSLKRSSGHRGLSALAVCGIALSSLWLAWGAMVVVKAL